MRIEIDDNLYVRSIEENDAEESYQLIINNKEYLSEWFGWVKNTKSVDTSLKYIKEIVEERNRDEGDDFIIIMNEKMIGRIGYWFKNDFTVNMGYWLAEDKQGNGYVTRCCKAIIEHLFTISSLHRLEIKVADENIKSRALIERLGLNFEGIMKDVDFRDGRYECEAVYSILSTEFTGY